METLSEYVALAMGGKISGHVQGGKKFSVVFETKHVQKETGTSMLKVFSFTSAL